MTVTPSCSNARPTCPRYFHGDRANNKARCLSAFAPCDESTAAICALPPEHPVQSRPQTPKTDAPTL